MKSVFLILTLIVASFASITNITAQSRTIKRAPRGSRSATNIASQSSLPINQSLPLRRVILYSNGVAYFERRGMVHGRAEINLPFKQSQVDDVLKSMVVLDLGQGRIGAVSYNSSAPPSARLNDIPFSIEAGTNTDDAQGGLAGVLRQLQGARVRVTSNKGTTTGAILTVEERKSQIDANKPPVTTHTLVIASEAGELMSFNLEEVRAVQLIDEGARRDLTQFADATASARRRDAKTIVVTSDGEGVRELVVSYTVAAPIWKTSYRVVLDDTGQPFFQGWAIVDNVSEEDWTNVQLSLVSGTPISFIQPIQQPLYRYRPIVPIPQDLKLDPQIYEPSSIEGGGGVGMGAGGGGNIGGGERKDEVRAEAEDTAAQKSALPAYSRRQAQNLQLNSSTQNFSVNGGVSAPVETRASDAITTGTFGVETAASGAEVGDLFEYRIDQPVTVRHDRSALIPILQTKLEGERVSVYNEGVRRDRPMSGMRLKNTSPLTLEDGALTVIDNDAYAGESLLQRFKPGEKRFITFALDLGTLVTARAKADREPVFLVKAVNGVLQVHYYQTEKKIYTVTNQTDRPHTVYIEHPLRNDWNLSDETMKPADKTARFYRFRVELKPRESLDLPVTERRALMDSYVISNLTSRDVELFFAQRYIDGATRAALDKIINIKTRIAGLDARMAAIDKEIEEISQDQTRLRENIKALKDTSEARQLIARYVAKADEQETRIEQLTNERRAAETERTRLQAELDGATRAFAVEQKSS
jgi:hypothetical protein